MRHTFLFEPAVWSVGGTFWALQGLHLTGPKDKSFMVGDHHWILYGAIFALFGLATLKLR